MRFKKSRLNTIFYGFLISVILCQNAAWGDIAIFGDSQNYEAVQRKIVQAVLSFKPSAVFRVGDNVNDGLNPEQWKFFKEINEPLLKTGAYFPALGNHEKDSPLYFDTFPFLNHRRWYSVERETIHFIILDSNSDLRPGSAQHDWLETDLQSITKDVKFRIVIFHHPIFDVGFHSADMKKLKAVLMPLFQKYEVSAVFSGHDHNYERFYYKGIFFIITGGGGSRLYGQFRRSPYLQKFKKTFHFCLLSADKDILKVKVIDIHSNIIDEFMITAPVSAEKQ